MGSSEEKAHLFRLVSVYLNQGSFIKPSHVGYQFNSATEECLKNNRKRTMQIENPRCIPASWITVVFSNNLMLDSRIYISESIPRDNCFTLPCSIAELVRSCNIYKAYWWIYVLTGTWSHKEFYSCLKKHGYNSHLDLPPQESFRLKDFYRKDGERNKLYILR